MVLLGVVGSSISRRDTIKSLFILAIALIPAAGQPARLIFTGTITGRLTGDDGTAISGGYVSLQLQPPYPKSRSLETEWNIKSASDGSFRFERLNEGVCKLCAQVPRSAWLNPCQWGLKPTVVTLSVSQCINCC